MACFRKSKNISELEKAPLEMLWGDHLEQDIAKLREELKDSVLA